METANTEPKKTDFQRQSNNNWEFTKYRNTLYTRRSDSCPDHMNMGWTLKKVEKNYNQTTSYAYFEQFVRFVLHSFSCFLTMCKMHVRAASWRKPLIIIIKLEIRAETEMYNRMKQKDTKVLYSTVKVWVCVLCVCVFCHLSLRDINNKMKR